MHKLLEMLASHNAVYNFMAFINSADHDADMNLYYKKFMKLLTTLKPVLRILTGMQKVANSKSQLKIQTA